MNVVSLYLLGLDESSKAAVQAAAAHAFSTPKITELQNLADAPVPKSASSTTLLILGQSSSELIVQAEAVKGSTGLPRWGVVVVGGEKPEPASSVVHLDLSLTVETVAELLRLAAKNHALNWENARLRGDISTIGRRISHDMRSPLSGIYTSCEAINEILSEQTTDHRVLTQAITQSTDDLIHIVERMSVLAKASAEPATKETVAMSEVVFASLQRVESAMQRKNATASQPAQWPKVHGVEAWLETIWVNLLRNALQHLQGEPAIAIGWNQETDGQIKFWIENKGAVPSRLSSRLFYPYHLLHHVDAPRGLGLPLVQRLVELQGGSCGSESNGDGVKFYFTLPAAS